MAAIAALLLLEGRGSTAATSWHEAMSVNHETEFAAWSARGEKLVRHTGQHASVVEQPTRLQWRAGDGRFVNLIMPALTRDRWATVVEWLGRGACEPGEPRVRTVERPGRTRLPG